MQKIDHEFISFLQGNFLVQAVCNYILKKICCAPFIIVALQYQYKRERKKTYSESFSLYKK